MIKRLLFTAALLWPGLADAASATLSVQINPVPPAATLSVQIVAAVSSNAPTPPAQAGVASFDTCVVCIDFTAPSGGVFVNGAQVSGVDASNPATWLDCAGAGSPIWFHKSNGLNTAALPCPDIVNDGMGNPRVLRMWNGPLTSANVNGMKLYNNDNATGIMVPTNNYMEATYIVPQFPHSGYIEGPWIGGGGEVPNSIHNLLEFDAFEVNTDTNPGAYASCMGSWYIGNVSLGCDWFGTFPPNYGSNNLTTQYLKIGQRVTNDGNTLYKCMWINDVFQNCTSHAVDGTALQSFSLGDAQSRMQTYLILTGTLQPDPGGTTSDMVAYTKSFNMWSCSNWQTIACRTGSADPGGY